MLDKISEATLSLSIYGIDLAKHSFSIHGEDMAGKGTDPKPFSFYKFKGRSKVLVTFANIPSALIGIEACGASHY
ncbi:hypothetical protein GCM10007086_29560 [Photobacterium aphoticum]|uniref:Mobile element protein n=1 Tax=Photobacterium aphoticum TaxID=754436 RepID=A0A0J1GJ16_9GAMM|nr:hypothetical protein ABT58_17130 [Photobacterium aphoticum]GHA53365.1 hypothetical protein GCM10007086_29560 [Photobacterium aphoticum]